jgi:hypothetical protein
MMNRRNSIPIFFAFLLILLAGCVAGSPEEKKASESSPMKGFAQADAPKSRAGTSAEDCADRKAPVEHIKNQLTKLVPSEMNPDLSILTDEERQVLELLVRASCCMDAAFFRQVYEWNYCIQEEFNRSVDPGLPWYQTYFNLMYGPWDRLNNNKAFLDADAKPRGANFYPLNISEAEWEAHLEAHPEDRDAFLSNFTMIRRQNGKLKAVPYSEYFQDQLGPSASLLKKAAEISGEPTLKRYLESRAESFASNDYFESDMDWMDLQGNIETVIGPYEVYEDRLFGYKAAFEAHICVVDHEESRKLARIEEYLKGMEKNLPILDEYKNLDRGGEAPIRVVNQVFTAGDARAGIVTAAFNLPNDERVREQKGSKKVLLKNVMQAKFEACAVPIAEVVLADEALDRLSFDAFFNIFLMHEVSHGLGPGKIEKEGRQTTVNQELKELDATIEECKAEVLSLYNIEYLVDQGVMSASLRETLYASFLADAFRAIRFGIEDAHGGAMAIQMNYYLNTGAFVRDEKGMFNVDDARMRDAVASLAREVLLIQARGDYEAAAAFIERYRFLKPEVAETLKRLEGVPVDIRPLYPVAQQIIERTGGVIDSRDQG